MTGRHQKHGSRKQSPGQYELTVFGEIDGGKSASAQRAWEAPTLHEVLNGESDYADFVNFLTGKLEDEAASLLTAEGARAAVGFVRGLNSKADDGARAQLPDIPDFLRRDKKPVVAA